MFTSKIRLLALIVMLLACSEAAAQPGTLCDDGSGGCGPWSVATTKGLNLPNGCSVQVDVRVRICGTKIQVTYDNLLLMDIGCNYFKDSTLWQLIDLALMEKELSDNGLSGSVPNCPDLTFTQFQFITTACYVWQKCTYTVLPNTPVCDTPPNPGVPGSMTVDVWTRHSCGTACCKREYAFCNDAGDLTISLVSKSIVGGTCTSSGSFTKPCNTGC